VGRELKEVLSKESYRRGNRGRVIIERKPEIVQDGV
jgi:hypothetical protein